MVTREQLEQIEKDFLAPYSAFSAESRGREHETAHDAMRTDYQRDRDRVIYSAGFRKLEYKTQVYVIHEGDYYRTRLTHTMEVAQIARTLAGNLRLNTDLAEAVALAHDLGHTPFGHSGEAVLHQLLENNGGFEHNRQGIRVVELLEERYERFPGLNLTWEVREGMAKHSTSYDSPCIERFLPELQPPLECQIVDIADEIAYNHHDLDDALKMGLINRSHFEEVSWIDELCRERVDRPGSPYAALETHRRYEIISTLIDLAVRDTLTATTRNINGAKVKTLDDVRHYRQRLVDFSDNARERNGQLRAFLMRNVYRHPYVLRMVDKGNRMIEQMYRLYERSPQQLPHKYQARIPQDSLPRVIADYISGMTDRYCLEEYRRSFLP
ncbi:deoxyguanosinetriphosphate triphosphohydrolase [bacterium]|nr:deoxyguanosinetriphosphate triphosphohydrolase [bacterium]